MVGNEEAHVISTIEQKKRRQERITTNIMLTRKGETRTPMVTAVWSHSVWRLYLWFLDYIPTISSPRALMFHPVHPPSSPGVICAIFQHDVLMCWRCLATWGDEIDRGYAFASPPLRHFRTQLFLQGEKSTRVSHRRDAAFLSVHCPFARHE